jgi:CBS-domain-containing membrane protein
METSVQLMEIMTGDVQCCTPDTNLAATAMIWGADCGALPAVDKGRLAGMITERDACITVGTKYRVPHELMVREIEATVVESCIPSDEVHDAVKIMRRAKVRRPPVIDVKGRLGGIVSVNDIALRANQAHKKDLSYKQVTNTSNAVNKHRSENNAHSPNRKILASAATAAD